MASIPRYASAVFLIELKRSIAYRFDFWIRIAATSGGRIALGYLLWRSIFESSGKGEYAGLSLHGMVLYYVFAAFALNAVVMRGGFIATEIYEGTFTRYLLYPISLFLYKYCSQLAQLLLGLVQVGAGLLIFLAFLGMPADIALTWPHLVLGSASILLAGTLYFFMSFNLELAAFWIDKTWSLSLILFFCANFLGGATLPLSLLPPWFERVLFFSPFPHLVYLPVQMYLGKLPLQTWMESIAVTSFWICVFMLSARRNFRRGCLRYAGVGV